MASAAASTRVLQLSTEKPYDPQTAFVLAALAAQTYDDRIEFEAELAARVDGAPPGVSLKKPVEFDGFSFNTTFIDLLRARDAPKDGPGERLLCAIYHDGTHTIISFRGTDNLDNWGTDLDASLVNTRWLTASREHRVHHGIKRALVDLLRNILDQLASIKNLGHVYITGHSLGGALAAQFLLFLLSIANGQVKADASTLFKHATLHQSGLYKETDPALCQRLLTNLTVYTFAAPRAASKVTCDYVQQLLTTAYPNIAVHRVLINGDIIPQQPPELLGYGHYGEAHELALPGARKLGEGEATRHSTTTYIQLLARATYEHLTGHEHPSPFLSDAMFIPYSLAKILAVDATAATPIEPLERAAVVPTDISLGPQGAGAMPSSLSPDAAPPAAAVAAVAAPESSTAFQTAGLALQPPLNNPERTLTPC